MVFSFFFLVIYERSFWNILIVKTIPNLSNQVELSSNNKLCFDAHILIFITGYFSHGVATLTFYLTQFWSMVLSISKLTPLEPLSLFFLTTKTKVWTLDLGRVANRANWAGWAPSLEFHYFQRFWSIYSWP